MTEPASGVPPLPDNCIWLIPVDTRPSQCLHVCIKPTNSDKAEINVVVSDYECLHGHRASHLMFEMVSGADTHYHIEVEEPPNCNVLKALEFMHADVPSLELEKCSALAYANTAHFLDMRRLSEEVISCASSVIRTVGIEGDAINNYTQGTSTEGNKVSQRGDGDSRSPTYNSTTPGNDRCNTGNNKVKRLVSPWDAIAALTLLGDPQKVLELVDLKSWYQRDPRLFEHPDLFSSCHFFGPKKFADIVKMMNEHHSMELVKFKTHSSQRVLGYSATASSLQADLRAVLHSYVGKQIVTIKGGPDGSGSSAAKLSSSTGTVVNGFIEKENAYVVIEWHLCASSTSIRLREFLLGGRFRLLERNGGYMRRQLSGELLKSRGAMKYA